MDNKPTFYLDDYNLIKAYLPKPFVSFPNNELEIYEDDESLAFKLEKKEEYEAYFKYTFTLAKEFTYTAHYRVKFGEKTYPLKLRHIVSKARFEKDFYPDVWHLGTFINGATITFRLWAPLCEKVRLFLLKSQSYYELEAQSKGVWEVQLKGDYDGAAYLYQLCRYGKWENVLDPFAYAAGVNSAYSIVLNPLNFPTERIKPPRPFQHYNEAIIYETSIRDITSSPTAMTKTHGKFLSLAEEETAFEKEPTALAYLKELGVTHIQLLPVFDFGSVDENEEKAYNWGYDPVQYNTVEGSYLVNKSDPYAYVKELRYLVNQLHRHNLYVNLDVVFNHVYQPAAFALAQLLPYYFFRYRDDEKLSDGSYCGNELRTEALFLHDYFVLSTERYLELFDIDGLRFDLMGLLDLKLLKDLAAYTRNVKAYFMLYGEGWDTPSALAMDKRAVLTNSAELPTFAFFNPRFRDVIKGGTVKEKIKEKGYVLGNLALKQDLPDMLSGGVLSGYFKEPQQSINYVECHDDHTFYDKMKLCLPHEKASVYYQRTKLALAFVLLSQGIPFIHNGQEFMATKYGLANSYNSGDYFNQVDYALRNQRKELVTYFRDLVLVRQKYAAFRLKDSETIKQVVNFAQDGELFIYEPLDLKVIFNPCENALIHLLNKKYLLLHDGYRFQNIEVCQEIKVPALTVLILKSIG